MKQKLGIMDIRCLVNSNKEEFISNTVESLEKDVKKYVIKDSRALYFFPLEKDRSRYYEQQSREYADRLDNNYLLISSLKRSKSR